MKRLIPVCMFVLLIFPIISADMIMPGYHGVSVHNYITNLNNFPDYVFITGPGEGLMCEIRVIGGDGNISGYYKQCSISIYAISKLDFNIEKINEINNLTRENYTIAVEKFSSLDKKEVIKDIDTYYQVPDSNSLKEESRYYSIDLEKVKVDPDKTNKNKSYLIDILSIGLSFIALVAIIVILIRRRK